MQTLQAVYTAKTDTGGVLKIEAQLPRELAHYVAWIMHHPEQAMALLPAFQAVRDQQESK